jgi:hypothetical protein
MIDQVMMIGKLDMEEAGERLADSAREGESVKQHN